MRLTLAFSFLCAAIAGACSIANPDHCANREGHATCIKQDNDKDSRCSKCVADNNGCTTEEVPDTCDAGTTSDSGTSTTAQTSTGDPPPTSTSSTTSTTALPTTDTTDTSTSTSTSTSTTSETTTGTTFDTTTGTTTTTTDTSTGTSTDTSTGTTESTTTDTTLDTTSETLGDTGTTMDGPMCGNNMQEDLETCDGTDLPIKLCVAKDPMKYGGGFLKCAGDCNSYDEVNCCVAPGEPCPGAGQKCCKPGLCVLTCP